MRGTGSGVALKVIVGRPRKPVAREANGRPRRDRGDVRALNIYNRGSRHHDWLKAEVEGQKREALGLAFGQIGRWEVAGLITTSEGLIARSWAIHVGEYEAAEGLPKRTARSPGFEVGHRGTNPLGESTGDQRRLKRLRDKQNAVLALLPAGRYRDAMYAWAIEDLHVSTVMVKPIRQMLSALKTIFGTGEDRRSGGIRSWRA